MPATMRLTEAELIFGMMTPTVFDLPVRRLFACWEGEYPVALTTARMRSRFSWLT